MKGLCIRRLGIQCYRTHNVLSNSEIERKLIMNTSKDEELIL